MSASDYLENKVLDHCLGEGARNFTSPAALYVALFTADPTDAGSYTNEVVATYGYLRQAVDFDAAAAGLSDNTAEIAFPQASGGNWGTITHVAVTDSPTRAAGNMLFSGALTASKIINDGDQLKIAAGDLDISLD